MPKYTIYIISDIVFVNQLVKSDKFIDTNDILNEITHWFTDSLINIQLGAQLHNTEVIRIEISELPKNYGPILKNLICCLITH